jgi:hypothetical protein
VYCVAPLREGVAVVAAGTQVTRCGGPVVLETTSPQSGIHEIYNTTTDFAKVLDHVRVVGNVGAHASDEHVDEQAARRALRFTTQVLRNLFEIPEELRAIDEQAADATENAAST